MAYAEESQFYCTRCGNRGMKIPRTGRQREAGHLKTLWCPWCKDTVNHVETREWTTYEVADFRVEFENGNFTPEGNRKEPYNEFKQKVVIKNMNKALWIVCGVPGSGKSIYLENMNFNSDIKVGIIHRDDIRFKLLAESNAKNYFDVEDKVWKEWVAAINKSLRENDVTYADATHISVSSRNKIIGAVKPALYEQEGVINILAFDVPLETCLERNAQREGLAKVPEDVIRNMYEKYEIPHSNERYRYEKIEIVRV